jgi:hypothetical protein
MKNKFLSSLCAVALGAASLSSCDKVKETIAGPATFDLNGLEATINVPIVNDLASHSNIGTGTFSYNIDSFIRAQTADQLGIKNIDEYYITSCNMTINNPDTANNFANFEQVQASFSTPTNTTPVTIAEIPSNPNTYAATLSVPVNSTTNLRSYMPNSGPITFTCQLGGKMRKVTNKVLTVKVVVTSRFHVAP